MCLHNHVTYLGYNLKFYHTILFNQIKFAETIDNWIVKDAKATLLWIEFLKSYYFLFGKACFKIQNS